MPEDRLTLDVASAERKISEFLSLFLRTSDFRATFDLQIEETDLGFLQPQTPVIQVLFEGPDAFFLIQRRGELLLALEHLATQLLHLEPHNHELISFDAADFKSRRVAAMRSLVERALAAIRTTGRPYRFPPMNSRERRMLHVELERVGLQSRSDGEARERCVTAYPGR